MQRSTLQKNLASAARVTLLAAAVFALAVSASMAIGASSAYAQSSRGAAQLESVPAPDVADPRAPRDPFPPFGYGGGPRAPRDTVGLGDIFDRFREFILRLFR
ncbi:hypothetical protein HY417_01195 [Candidatus Kaiserbacteria bacterium]|nr:hypothetical protein [Candidatus Kaiserbacteria bacterium]